MDALASAYDSDDASSPSDEKEGETSGLNFEESASMLQAIKEKYNTDSAPRVADKVVYTLYWLANNSVLLLDLKFRIIINLRIYNYFQYISKSYPCPNIFCLHKP